MCVEMLYLVEKAINFSLVKKQNNSEPVEIGSWPIS